MWTITAEKSFEAGHRLTEYKGKCSRIHGHNYRVVVAVKGLILNNWGAVVDFGEIKKWLAESCEKLDHRMVVKDCAENRKLFKMFPKDWIIWVDWNPTAEEFAHYFYDILDYKLTVKHKSKLELAHVTVYETPTNSATYSGFLTEDDECYVCEDVHVEKGTS